MVKILVINCLNQTDLHYRQ